MPRLFACRRDTWNRLLLTATSSLQTILLSAESVPFSDPLEVSCPSSAVPCSMAESLLRPCSEPSSIFACSCASCADCGVGAGDRAGGQLCHLLHRNEDANGESLRLPFRFPLARCRSHAFCAPFCALLHPKLSPTRTCKLCLFLAMTGCEAPRHVPLVAQPASGQHRRPRERRRRHAHARRGAGQVLVPCPLVLRGVHCLFVCQPANVCWPSHVERSSSFLRVPPARPRI
jgi:hypothetical protein